MPLSGRTVSIISRFPHFYASEDPNSAFHQFVNVFGEMLDRVEADLVQVLRSHFVDTAENVDSQGFTSAQRGDLDQIFALYLEQLGGTSQLTQVNPQFQPGEFKQVNQLVYKLLRAATLPETEVSLDRYLWQHLPPDTQALLYRYDVKNARFVDRLQIPTTQLQAMLNSPQQALLALPLSTAIKQKLQKIQDLNINKEENLLLLLSTSIQQLQNDTPSLGQDLTATFVMKLMACQDSLTTYLRDRLWASPALNRSPEVNQLRTLIAAYDGATPVPDEIAEVIASRLNYLILPDPFLYQRVLERNAQLTLQLQLLSRFLEQPSLAALASVSEFLVGRLSIELQRSIADSDQAAQLNQSFPRLSSELRPHLQSFRLCQQLLTLIQQPDRPVSTRPAIVLLTLWQAIRLALSRLLAIDLDASYLVPPLELLQRYEQGACLENHLLSASHTPGSTLQTEILSRLQPLLQTPSFCETLRDLMQTVLAFAPQSFLSEPLCLILWQQLAKHLRDYLQASPASVWQQEMLQRLGNPASSRKNDRRRAVRISLIRFLTGAIVTTPSIRAGDRSLLSLEATVTPHLQKLLQSKSVCQQLLMLLESAEAETINLPTGAVPMLLVALVDVAQTTLRQLLAASLSGFIIQLNTLPPDVKRLSEQSPVGDHLERLNRQLLETIYPLELPQSQIPTQTQVAVALATAFNEQVLGDRQLYATHTAEFAQLPLNLTTQELLQRSATHEFTEANLIHLNRLLLEAAYPNDLEKCETPYRERLKRLIEVLKTGASTKDGIVDIVAANLGMSGSGSQAIQPWEAYVGKLPLRVEPALMTLFVTTGLCNEFAKYAVFLTLGSGIVMEVWMQCWLITDAVSGQVYRLRKQESSFSIHRQLIRVIEYSLRPNTRSHSVHPHPSGDSDVTEHQTLPTAFTVSNRTFSTIQPTLSLIIRDRRPGSARQLPLPTLGQLQIINATTKQQVEYLPQLEFDQELILEADGSVQRVGVKEDRDHVLSEMLPTLPAGDSEWRIQATTDFAAATFDQCNLDFARFDEAGSGQLEQEQVGCYEITSKITSYELAPGNFTVRIPWDIPNYTDRFSETDDHPRHQINGLINKVRAAGVESLITYEKQFPREDQDLQDQLQFRQESVIQIQKNLDEGSLDQQMQDSFMTCAMFDYTYFNSLNGFA